MAKALTQASNNKDSVSLREGGMCSLLQSDSWEAEYSWSSGVHNIKIEIMMYCILNRLNNCEKNICNLKCIFFVCIYQQYKGSQKSKQ